MHRALRISRVVPAAILACGLVPCARADEKTWKNAATGDWFTADNWMGGLPGANDDATISVAGAAYTVRVNGNVTVNQLTLNSANAALFAGGRTITLTEQAVLLKGTVQFISTSMTHKSPAATSALSSEAHFVMKGTSEYKGVHPTNEVTNIGSSGSFTVMGVNHNNAVLPANFTLRGGLFNHKSVSLDSTANTSATLNLTRLVNYEEGRVDFKKGAGGARTLNAELLNLGKVNVETNSTITNPGANRATNGGTITISKDATLTHNGAFDNEYAERDMGGNIVRIIKGTLAGEGTFAIRAGDFGKKGKFDPKKIKNLGPRGGPDDVATLTIDTEDLALDQDTEFDIDLGSFGNDLLAVTGTASAYDTLLNVRLVDGFVPFLGQAFTVMTFAPSNPADFSFTLAPTPGIGFDVVVTSTEVILTTVAVPGPGTFVIGLMVIVPVAGRRRR